MAGTGRKAENTEECPLCRKGTVADNTQGTRVCSSCGTIFKENLQTANSGNMLPVQNTQVFRIRKWRQRARVANAAEKSLAFAMSEIERVAASNELHRPIIDGATSVYKKAVEKNMIRGRSTQTVVAASVYTSCRICGVPRTLEEIAESCDIGKKELGRTYRLFRNNLKLDLPLAKPQDYVTRYCEELNLSSKVKEDATLLLDRAAEKEMLSGLGPAGIAAGAVYISANRCKENRSQSEVATVADISEVTLRCRYKKLAESFGIILEF